MSAAEGVGPSGAVDAGSAEADSQSAADPGTAKDPGSAEKEAGSGAAAGPLAAGELPPADGPPPTMPVEARTGGAPPPPPPDALAEGAGGVPEGTAPEVAAAPGASEELPPAVGVHRPEVGPGGDDLDTAARPLPNRADPDRR